MLAPDSSALRLRDSTIFPWKHVSFASSNGAHCGARIRHATQGATQTGKWEIIQYNLGTSKISPCRQSGHCQGNYCDRRAYRRVEQVSHEDQVEVKTQEAHGWVHWVQVEEWRDCHPLISGFQQTDWKRNHCKTQRPCLLGSKKQRSS
jgi:hypothetical protein